MPVLLLSLAHLSNPHKVSAWPITVNNRPPTRLSTLLLASPSNTYVQQSPHHISWQHTKVAVRRAPLTYIIAHIYIPPTLPFLPVLMHPSLTTPFSHHNQTKPTSPLLYIWSTMSSTLATQKATTQTVLDAYNAWDIEKILAFRAPDCVQQVLPASMGRPALGNKEYRERLEGYMRWFRNFNVSLTPSNSDSDFLS